MCTANFHKRGKVQMFQEFESHRKHHNFLLNILKFIQFLDAINTRPVDVNERKYSVGKHFPTGGSYTHR